MLCNTEERLNALNQEDLSAYPFLAIYDLGNYAERMEPCEIAMSKANFARFMRRKSIDDCLVLPKDFLIEYREHPLLQNVAGHFKPQADIEAYIAVADIQDGAGNGANNYHCEPFDMANGTGRFPYASVISNTLAKLEQKLWFSALN